MLDADSNALKVQCLQAEAEVIELKGKIVMMNQRSGYRESPKITSAAMEPLSFPTLSGLGSGLTAQTSRRLGGEMSGLEVPQASPLPAAGEAPQRSFLGLFQDQLDAPHSSLQGQDWEGATCLHQAHTWRRPAQVQDKSKGLVKLEILKGQIRPLRHPRS